MRKKLLTTLVAVAATSGCATIPDGCYMDAYQGKENCYQSGEVVKQRELTNEEHLMAIQQERLRLQQQAAASQSMQSAATWMMLMQPPQPMNYHGTWTGPGGDFGTFNIYGY